ncbi:MAG: hypothetical protein ACU84Q_00600 [Gammaproteobacteria bacterium]
MSKLWRGISLRDAAEKPPRFVEISRHLVKAGLIESFDTLIGQRKTNLILLRRDPFKVAWS